MCSPINTSQSPVITSSRQKLNWWTRSPLPKLNWWNHFGREYGAYQCRVRLEIFFGGPVETLFQLWIIWSTVAWWKIQSVLFMPNTMRMLSMPCGLARPLHRCGTKTLNGVLEAKTSSQFLAIWSSMFLSRDVVPSCLLCRFGLFGPEETKSDQLH